MSDVTTMPISRALNAGLRAALADSDRVLLMGEDIGKLGGVFRVTEGLQAEFGDRRVLDTPLAESGIVGTAIGLAMAGFRPVCEIQFDGFVFPAFDQITSQLAKFTNRHEGALQMPVVIRIPYGGHIGAVEHGPRGRLVGRTRDGQPLAETLEIRHDQRAREMTPLADQHCLRHQIMRAKRRLDRLRRDLLAP